MFFQSTLSSWILKWEKTNWNWQKNDSISHCFFDWKTFAIRQFIRRSCNVFDYFQSNHCKYNAFAKIENVCHSNKFIFSFEIQNLMKYQIVDRLTSERCIRCFQIEKNKSNFIFFVCRRVKNEFETCDECWFRHKTSKCFLNMFVFLFDSKWIDNWFMM